MELFFDDTEIEVAGHQFEGARINYEGNRALSWQDLYSFHLRFGYPELRLCNW